MGLSFVSSIDYCSAFFAEVEVAFLLLLLFLVDFVAAISLWALHLFIIFFNNLMFFETIVLVVSPG
jgi:hypothetical protein